MKSLSSRFNVFYKVCCDFLDNHSRDSYYNSDSSYPGFYSSTYKGFDPNKVSKRLKNKKKKLFNANVEEGKKISKSSLKRREKRRRDYFLTEDGDVFRRESKGDIFTCDGINCFKHKETSNVRVGTRPQKFDRPPECNTDFFFQFTKVFEELNSREVLDEKFELNRHVIVDGCFDTNKHVIQAQMDCKNFLGRATPSERHLNMMAVAVRDAIRKLKIEDLGDVSINDIRDFDFNLDTKPGFRFEHYLKKNYKKNCVDEAVFLAEERYASINKASAQGRFITRDEICPGFYTIGARSKRETDPIEGDAATSRAIHIPEFHVELHGGCFSDKITSHFIQKGEGPIFIGNSFTKFDRFGKLLDLNEFAVEGDWKKFDSTLSNSLITFAVGICRLYFPEGILYDNHFLAILDSLVIKDYHVVGGRVYRILHGLPSGSKWTSIIGSIINLIALNYTFSSIKYYDRSFAIGGDDFVVFVKNDKYEIDSLQETVEAKAAEIGMTIKYFKLKCFKGSDDVNDFPVFYKYTVFKGFPIIPLESVITRVFSPWNKRYKSNSAVLGFLDDIFPSLAAPSTGCYLFYLLYIYIYYRVTKKLLKIEDLVVRHERIFNKVMREDLDSHFIEVFNVNSVSIKRNFMAGKLKSSKDFLKKIFNF